MIKFPSIQYTDWVRELLARLTTVLKPERLSHAEDYFRYGDPDLAVEAAARMVVEDEVPLTAELAELLVALLAPTEWASHVPAEDLRALVR